MPFELYTTKIDVDARFGGALARQHWDADRDVDGEAVNDVVSEGADGSNGVGYVKPFAERESGEARRECEEDEDALHDECRVTSGGCHA